MTKPDDDVVNVPEAVGAIADLDAQSVDPRQFIHRFTGTLSDGRPYHVFLVVGDDPIREMNEFFDDNPNLSEEFIQ